MSTAGGELPSLEPLGGRRTEAAAPRPERPIHPVEAVVAALAAGAGLLLLGRTAFGAYLNAPVADVIDWAARVFQAERDHRWLGYLWDPHTAQRIPLARLVEALDIEAARGRWPSYLVATALFWLGGCAALLASVAGSRLPPSTRLWLAALAALLATNVALAEDAAFPVFSVYLLVAGPALAAACLLQRARREGLGSLPLWGAIACAALASGGNAAGLAIWPALLVTALLQGRSRGQIAALGIAAVLVGVTVEAGLGVPSSSLDRAAGTASDHLVKVATYFAIFAGLPWTRSVHTFALAALVGALAWALAALGLTRARPGREDEAAGLSSVGVSLILFGALTAALASVGRVDELATPTVPTRYTPFAVLLQLGVLLALARGFDSAVRRRWPGWAVAALIGALVLSHDVHGSRSLLRASAKVRAASDDFDRTGTQGDVWIYPVAARATQVRRELAARGLPH